MLFQSPLPLQKMEPVMIYDSIKTKPLTVTSKAGYCTDKPPTLDPKLWAKYKHFQVSVHNDQFQLQYYVDFLYIISCLQAAIDKPVYLAGGKGDKILLGITVALCALGTLQSFVFIAKEALQII